jgi:hypothetical protein
MRCIAKWAENRIGSTRRVNPDPSAGDLLQPVMMTGWDGLKKKRLPVLTGNRSLATVIYNLFPFGQKLHRALVGAVPSARARELGLANLKQFRVLFPNLTPISFILSKPINTLLVHEN